MFRHNGSLSIVINLFIVLGLSGCGGGSNSAPKIVADPTGFVSIAITDAPVDTVSVVNVQFTGVTLKPQNDTQIDIVFDVPTDLDLLTLRAGVTAELLAQTPVPVGKYEWIRLMVNAEFDSVFDSYATTPTGDVELRVPSGTQNGLKLVSGFTVFQDQATNLVIDWDLRKALSNPVGLQGFHLRPALRITNMASFGTLTGIVTAGLIGNEAVCTNDLMLDTGNAVYIYTGAVEVPGDIGDATVEPYTTATVAQNSDGDYAYEVNYLATGDYSAAFTCQASDDDPDTDDDIVFTPTQPFTIVNGMTEIVNF